MRRIVLFSLAFFLLSLLLFQTTPSRAVEPYRIGLNLGLTGPLGMLGEEHEKGAQVGLDEIEAKGGIKGHPIKVFKYDNECKGEKALINARKLIKQDEVGVSIGPSKVNTLMATMDEYNKGKVPVLEGAGGFPINEYLKPGIKNYIFSVNTSAYLQSKFQLEYMKKKGWTTLAILNPLSEMGEYSTKGFLDWADANNVKILTVEKYDPNSGDLTPQLIKIKGLNPQTLATMGTGRDAIVMVKNFHQLGMKIPFFVSFGNNSLSWIKALSGNTEYVMLPGPTSTVSFDLIPEDSPQKPLIKKFIEGYEKRYGKIKDTFWSGCAYDYVLIASAAFEKVGSDGEKIRDFIENLKDFVGVHGIYSYSPTNHICDFTKGGRMLKIKDDRWVFAD
jgi:branched-chain amino acid transport system substrate-binding protein